MGTATLLKKMGTLAIVLPVSLSLFACAALDTRISKKDLDVQTITDNTIFLEPAPAKHHIIYVSLRNTSDKQLEVKNKLLGALAANGYQITDDPDQAYLVLQANVRNVKRVNLSEINSVSNTVDASATGALIAQSISGDDGPGAAILGGLAGLTLNATTKDILYVMVTDIRIRERSSLQSPWQDHKARIVSEANEVNLDFDKALPALEDGLTDAISGIFVE